MSVRLLIIGGYGNTGSLIADLALKHIPNIELVLAGRNAHKAQQAAEKWQQLYPENNITHVTVDAADYPSLESAFKEADMAIMAAGTMEHTSLAARAALATGTDYMDTQLSNPDKLAALQALEKDIIAGNRLFITDAGFHPGVPAAMVRYAAKQMDELHEGIVYSALRINWKQYHFSESTILEMVHEFKDYVPQIIVNGAWKTVNWKNMPRFDFKAPIGRQYCVPMVMNEFEKLAQTLPSLNKAGFYVTGFNPVVDYLITPLMISGLKWIPKLDKAFGKLFVWGLKTFGKPSWLTLLVLEAKGQKNGNPASLNLRMSHTDAYYLTAAPIVACLKQYCAGKFTQPGLWYQAMLVEPELFLQDLKELNITIEVKLN